MQSTRRARRHVGFTLVELVVVTLIIGVLAAFGIAQYSRVVERGRVAEVFNSIAAINMAQQRYMTKTNIFASASSDLDVPAPTTKYFGSLTITGNSASFTVTFTRSTPTNSTYGAYVLSYIGPAGTFLCSNADCQADLLP